jgi:EAL domain-containing protein (putative c-di-GMP-specific phosphodiesterase class I)
VSINISAGIVFYGDGKSIDNLINYATIARKFAKSENKKFLVYEKEMQKDDDYANNIKLINEIKEALEEQRIVAYFQPIIDNSNDTITKYEALVRMIDKNGKAISPFFFLDTAKKAKLYSYISIIMIDKVFELSLNKSELDVTINLEVEDVMSDKTCKYIFDKLDNHPYPEHIVFEITESQEIKNYEAMQVFIKKVKGYGSKIAIDDFGSGYSNFEQVLALQADIIKIDGSLIKNIATDKNSRIITETIINFSKRLGSKTVVEFVHNKEVSSIVKELGADYSQGFYLGEPKPETVDIQHSIKTIEV